MGMGTFDAFTSARLGIYAAQYGLKVTGNNVSNINTEGYTRQRVNQLSFKAGAYDRYRSQMDNHVGSGALIMGINQIRDPYLDVRFRNTNADVGYHDRMLAGLQEIADILDEIGKGETPEDNEKGDGLLYAQLQDLADKLRAYGDEPTKGNNDLVRTSAEILCDMFNKYADKLEVLYQDTVKDFHDEVTIVNECLTNIRDLNREIRDCEIYGDTALELRDERNRQIDKLSEYLHIKVVYTEELIGGIQKVEKLSIFLDDANPDPKETTDESMLIDGVFGAQLTYPENRLVRNPQYGVDRDPLKDYLYKTELKVGDVDPRVDRQTDPPTVLDAPLEWGTNDPAKAIRVKNDDFSLEISKLIDVNDKEWTSATTLPWQDISQEVKSKATYEFPITAFNGKRLEELREIGVAGENLKLTEDDLKDNASLAAAIAKKYNEVLAKEVDPKFTVKAEGDKIIFQATKEGRLAQEDIPSLSDIKRTGLITIGDGTCTDLGVSYKLPEKDPDTNQPIDKNTVTKTTDPVTGEEIIVSYKQDEGKWYKVTTKVKHTYEVGLDDNDLHGAIQATRELLTEKGEFSTKDTIANIDERAEEKRGIPYYQLSLDLLARQFATQYNQINTGYMQDKDGYYIKEDGTKLTLPRDDGEPVKANGVLSDAQKEALLRGKYYLKDENGDPILDEDGKEILDLNAWLENPRNGAVKMGGLLFSNRNDRDSEGDPDNLEKDPYITAANISVAHKWSTGAVELVPTYKVLFLEEDGKMTPHTTQSDNAGHMLNMIERDLVYNPQVLVPDAVSNRLFEGNFNGMFDKMNTICGQDIRSNNTHLNNAYTQLIEIDTQRDGVSGVDLNDEAMNMMQYQKALNAAMRMMTVIDEALDRLINNTGIAGR